MFWINEFRHIAFSAETCIVSMIKIKMNVLHLDDVKLEAAWYISNRKERVTTTN